MTQQQFDDFIDVATNAVAKEWQRAFNSKLPEHDLFDINEALHLILKGYKTNDDESR